jgi:hypothetical protein
MIRGRARLPTAVLLTALSLAPACDRADPTAIHDLQDLASPAAPGSGEPNLFALGERVYLSWLEPLPGGEYALRFAAGDGTGWSEARTIATGADFFVNWADFPSVVALPDGRLAAHWLVRSGPGTYAYDVHLSQSHDGGRSWSPGVVPHRDGTQTEHGFASLFPWHDGHLAAVWLDGRNFEGAPAHGDHASGPEMMLRQTTFAPDGTLGPETVLDGRICDCCQTAVALTSRGPLVAYRDRSPDEIRDISVVRYDGGRWSEPRPVHRDGWQIPGCPVNGPAAAARGERVAVAWFTAAQERPRVYIAFSDDAGSRFASPVRLDGGDPLGRVDVVLLDDGDALVSWIERVGDGAEIRLRRVTRAGRAGPHATLSATAAARAAGFPRIARLGDRLVIAWTQPGDPREVRTVVARLR